MPRLNEVIYIKMFELFVEKNVLIDLEWIDKLKLSAEIIAFQLVTEPINFFLYLAEPSRSKQGYS